MEKLCHVCNNPLNLIPAGVSKKNNKPYDAFWSCKNRCQQPYGSVSVEPKVSATGQISGKNEGLSEVLASLKRIEKFLGMRVGESAPYSEPVKVESDEIKAEDLPF